MVVNGAISDRNIFRHSVFVQVKCLQATNTKKYLLLKPHRLPSLFWMEKFRKILPRKCRTPLLFAVNLSNYLNMQNRLLKWPLSREKMLRWYG